MNLFNRTIIVVYVLSLTGCTKFDDYIYEVINMSATNVDNAGAKPIDAPSDTISKNMYAIKLQLTMQYKGTTGDEVDSHESGYVNEDRLVSFNVYTLNNFDSIHPAGASLNNCFLVSGGGTYSANSTMENQVKNGTIGTSQGYTGNSNDTWTSNEYLILMKEPATNGDYSFVIDIGLSDSRHLIDTVKVNLY